MIECIVEFRTAVSVFVDEHADSSEILSAARKELELQCESLSVTELIREMEADKNDIFLVADSD